MTEEELPIALSLYVVCPSCNGSGKGRTIMFRCSVCNGYGSVKRERETDSDN